MYHIESFFGRKITIQEFVTVNEPSENNHRKLDDESDAVQESTMKEPVPIMEPEPHDLIQNLKPNIT